MTVEAIRENPWNVIAQPLPQFPSRLLLEVACRAARYCVASEHHLMEAARGGRYIPAWFNTDEILPDAHEVSEDRWLQALTKLEEFGAVIAKMPDEAD